MPHVLVLNASYEPLGVVSMRRALILVLNHKAIALEDAGTTLHSATGAVQAPSVVKLTRFVRVPYRGPVPLTRRALFARDHGRCVYCGAAATSVDHVIPRSRGGQHRWDNVVAACRRCNHTKADMHLADLGWRMKRPPAAPSGLAWRVIGTGIKDPRWRPYLEPYGGLDQFRDFEHHDHPEAVLPVPVRPRPIRRGEQHAPLSA
ncbi:MAG: HNH endonuclease [Kitasatospora sp.]|nr:HNH endonuclease [Kitasatospora sp.]